MYELDRKHPEYGFAAHKGYPTKKHLENLGFTVGAHATVINTLGGNIIVKIKESRVAIDCEMANKILI